MILQKQAAMRSTGALLEKSLKCTFLPEVMIILLTFLLLAGPVADASTDAVGDLQLKGFGYLKNKEFPQALECFRSALKDHPDSWRIMQSIGCCHMELGHYGTAIAYFQKSIEAGGLHVIQCSNMASVYQRMGDTKKALNWLKLACSIDPAAAGNPVIRDRISKLEDVATTARGSSTTPDYFSSLVSVNRWPKESMPIKVYVRNNIQIPDFYDEFISIVRASFDQWCAATNGAISYKLVPKTDDANIVCDYTDHRELISSRHELGIDGNTEMLTQQDNSPGPTNIAVLVKDDPRAPTFMNRERIRQCCLHEIGHALGMHGHSSSNQDMMFPTVVLNRPAALTDRDKMTMRKIYHVK